MKLAKKFASRGYRHEASQDYNLNDFLAQASPIALASRRKVLKDNNVLRLAESDNSVSTSILERAKLGDQDAFRIITELYAGLVYHWIRKKGLSPQDAQDVSQEVFGSVIHNLKRFHRTNADQSFRAWIRVITRSKIADHFRKSVGVEIALGGDNPLFDFVSNEKNEEHEESNHDKAVLYQKAVEFIKGEFADKDWRAFLMLVVDEIPAREVAEILGNSVNSVYIAKSRILKRLHDEFGGLIDDETI
ncbi:MAG: sigma-70 family RNA polymerase sigma factor [Pirellula sp.]|jgi:RNA polymerase sigma-70 factor (ECF subfamily)|nr:sigma-70 family RNA polymerase sigma factor [Pirellula sp.]